MTGKELYELSGQSGEVKKREEEFFGKGKKESRKRMWRGVKSLTKARGEAASQRKKRAEEAFKIAEPEIKEKPKPKKIKLQSKSSIIYLQSPPLQLLHQKYQRKLRVTRNLQKLFFRLLRQKILSQK